MDNLIDLISVLGYKMDMSTGNPPNAHQGYQLFYNLAGTTTYMIDGVQYTLNAGDCIIVPPFIEHTVTESLNPEQITIDIQFSAQNLDFNKKIRGISTKVHHLNTSSKELIKILVTEARKRNGYFYHTVRNLLETLLMILIDQNENCLKGDINLVSQNFNQFSVGTRRLLVYLDGMFVGNREFDLPYVAKILGYNQKYMCKMFNEEVGIPIKQYLMMMRIEKSKELIAFTNCSIKEISELLNFNSFVYFERKFKQHVGISPREYRVQNSGIRKPYLEYSFHYIDEVL